MRGLRPPSRIRSLLISVWTFVAFLRIASVDRYGRKIAKDEGKRLVKKFYHLEEEEEKEVVEYDPARGIGVASSSSEDEEETDEQVESDEIDSFVIEEEIPKGDATLRLAAVNLDWDNIRAVDILAVFQSFIPPASEETINRVVIYPSEFGKQRLQKEATDGPAIFDSMRPDEHDVDHAVLRKYQLERLRYYYAIIECSSVPIANHLYKSLDGAELGATANIFDLRFVPDDTTFDDTPRDEATSVPDRHEPSDFVTDALQHSKPKLTWEGEDPERKRLISEAFKEDSEGGKWEALLGSGDEEEENEDNREKYRRLLLGQEITREDNGGEMEVAFPAFREEEEEEVKPQEETTLEKYKKKERERKERKRAVKLAKREVEENPVEDLGFNDPFFESSTSALKKKEKEAKRAAKQALEEERTKRASELELLMHDEQNQSIEHFNINHILKHQKATKLKKKKRDAEKEVELQESFKMDVNDPRFATVYEGGEFAIDPNSSAFRKGLPGMQAILEETRRRKRTTPDRKQKRRKI
jgi:NUC153 domain